MIITIDMVTGDITEERSTESRNQREQKAADMDYPGMDVGLQIYDPTQEKPKPYPDTMVDVDIDTFISQMKN